jgi:Flp pilus assembly protein TadG
MIKRLKQLARNKSGAAIIELALAAPVLATMVIGVTDISIAYGKKLQLEQAAQRAIEKVGQTTGAKTPEDTIKDEAQCQYNGADADGACLTSPLSADDVTVTYSLKCNGVATPFKKDDGDLRDCVAGETTIRYISAKLVDTYTPMFNMHFGTNSDGEYDLSATAGVRVQ